jgi:L-alanine-DL-glutamate epimerase-like enolase superfamily enzyme
VLNVNSHVSDVIRAGWLAAEANIEVAFGNTMFESGVNAALALPGVRWLEHSFQNFEHLVERPYVIRDGLIFGHDAPGHGLVLSSEAKTKHRRPAMLARDELGPAPIWSPDRICMA